jgi:hypothetical protein
MLAGATRSAMLLAAWRMLGAVPLRQLAVV